MLPVQVVTGSVVVGCDGSWHSEQAVRVATMEARRRGAGLVLLAVAEVERNVPDRLQWLAQATEDAVEGAKAVAERALTHVVELAPTQPTQVVIATDFAAPEVAATGRVASLLVLGRHGLHGQLAFSLGSTSAELARRFACPVLIGRDQSSLDEPGRGAEPPVVLVGLDAGKDCARVLRVAADEAAVRGARLVAVHALNASPAHTNVALAVGWRRVHDAMRSAGLPVGVPSRLVITRDDPVTALLLRARPQDLLVVGTRGGGRLAGLVQGSVSRAVLDAMPCDVLVVPQPRPGQPGNQSNPGDLALAGTDAAQRP